MKRVRGGNRERSAIVQQQSSTGRVARALIAAAAITHLAFWAGALHAEDAPLTITTELLPEAAVGQAYYQPLTATGGVTPYTWTVYRGALPTGLVIDPYSGVIYGTPSVAGSYSFKVKVKDSASGRGKKRRRRFTIEVVQIETKKYSCNHEGGCIEDPNGIYTEATCGNQCDPSTSEPDLALAYRILQEVAQSHSVGSCPTWPFLDAAVERLRQTNTRWGYHLYPRTKNSFVISQDRIAWYKGSGEPDSGSGSVLAYDIIQNYCSDSRTQPSKLRKPSLKDSSEFDHKDKWVFPRE